MIKKYKDYINEGLLSRRLHASFGGDKRKEDIDGFDRYLKSIEWVDMNDSEYLYAKFDFPFSDFNDKKGCSIDDIIEFEKKLPDGIQIMSFTNLQTMLKKKPDIIKDNSPKQNYRSLKSSDNGETITFSLEPGKKFYKFILFKDGENEVSKSVYQTYIDNLITIKFYYTYKLELYPAEGYPEPIYSFKLVKLKK